MSNRKLKNGAFVLHLHCYIQSVYLQLAVEKQNAQWIPQSPQTEKGIVGRVRVTTGLHSTSLSTSLTQTYFCSCAHQRPRQKICTVHEKLFHNGRARKLQGFISRPLLEKQTLAHTEFRLVNFLPFMSFTSRYLP